MNRLTVARRPAAPLETYLRLNKYQWEQVAPYTERQLAPYAMEPVSFPSLEEIIKVVGESIRLEGAPQDLKQIIEASDFKILTWEIVSQYREASKLGHSIALAHLSSLFWFQGEK